MMNNRLIIILAVVLLCGRATGQTPIDGNAVDSIIEEFRHPSGKVLVAAHRGDWRHAPENSIPAIERCIGLGVDIVEVDVKRTRDGHLVLMHDDLLDRTTTGKGAVKDWTLDSLRTLYLRDGLGLPTRYRIPTLEEALIAVRGRVMINLDKCYPYFREAYAIAAGANTLRQVLMKGTAPADEVLEKHGALLKDVFYMPVINLDKPGAASGIPDCQRRLKPPAFEFIFSKDTTLGIEQCKRIKESGTRVWINALKPNLNGGHDDDLALTDPEAGYGWLLATGATIIQTDRPTLLLQYLRSKGLHH